MLTLHLFLHQIQSAAKKIHLHTVCRTGALRHSSSAVPPPITHFAATKQRAPDTATQFMPASQPSR